MLAHGHNVSVSVCLSVCVSLASLYAVDNVYGQRKNAMCLVRYMGNSGDFSNKIKYICSFFLTSFSSVDAFSLNIPL